MTSTTHAIHVDRLTKRYGELPAVDDVSFTVKPGEVFAFLGPNGAGKSTTIEIIETIRSPTSGKVTLLGMDAATHKAQIVKKIGVLPQEFRSFDRITVRETIHYFAQVFGSKADINSLMDLTNIRPKADAQFVTLSGGLKQRVGIAVALVNDPEIIFLDEPTTGLDPHARREVWDVMNGLKSRGKTVFLTTHYMEEAELLADTVAIISKGKIVAIDTPQRLTAQHAEHIRLTLKSTDNRLQGLVQQMGYAVEPLDDHELLINITGPDDVRRILAQAEQSKVTLAGIDVRKPNLEEVFLKLTGETLKPNTVGGHS